MGADQLHDWQAEAASTLEWWRDAGVDCLVDTAPRNWLARGDEPDVVSSGDRDAVASAAPLASPTIPELPTTLEAFLAWRTGPDAPEARWGGAEIVPPGATITPLMVFVDMPEDGDAAAGALLGGAPGRLFDRMLAAIGLDRSAVTLSALALSRPATGQIPTSDAARLADIARHHIGLLAPKRVLLLGQAASRALLEPEAARQRGTLQAINHSGGQSPAIASFHPRFLLARPAAKAESWRDLQLLKKGLDQ